MSSVRPGYVRPLDLKHGQVDMSHGGGGRAMVQLISDLFARELGNELLDQGNDGTVLPAAAGRLVVSQSARTSNAVTASCRMSFRRRSSN